MENVTLKVQLGSFAVEVTGEPDYAEAKLDELVQKYLKGPSPQAAHIAPDQGNQTGKKLAPSEFLKSVSPKNQPERALALAYYLEKYESMENFTTSDLTEICKKAKQSAFTNISDTVAKLVSQGLEPAVQKGTTYGKMAGAGVPLMAT